MSASWFRLAAARDLIWANRAERRPAKLIGTPSCWRRTLMSKARNPQIRTDAYNAIHPDRHREDRDCAVRFADRLRLCRAGGAQADCTYAEPLGANPRWAIRLPAAAG